MAEKLVIVMAHSEPRKPNELVPPFSQATVAATMEYDVEMIFTGAAGEIVKRGVAEDIRIKAAEPRTAYDMICEAREAGVKMKVCTSALEAWGDDFIAEVEETVGGAYLISEAMDDKTVVLTY